jgi:hypothetical protein
VATPGWPAEVLFGLSTAMWISLSAAYVVMRLRGSGSFTADRLHPVYGPYTALGTQDAEQDPGDEGAGDTEQAS